MFSEKVHESLVLSEAYNFQMENNIIMIAILKLFSSLINELFYFDHTLIDYIKYKYSGTQISKVI